MQPDNLVARLALAAILGLGVSGCGGGGGGGGAGGGGGGPNELTSGSPRSDLAGATGEQAVYEISVPAGATSLTAVTSGGTGDMDLYLRHGAAPTTTTYDCVSGSATNDESCTVNAPASGTWYVMLNAYSTYSGVTLTVTVTAPSGGGGGGTTPAGFGLLKDINPSGSSEPALFVPVGANTYFIADDGVHGRELWLTDGTTAGTRLVKDVYPGSASGASYIDSLSVLGSKLLFVAEDGTASGALWITDGTTAGTQRVKDITTTTAENIRFLGTAGSRAYFWANDGVHGIELWTSDGTTAGTYMVADLTPGSTNSNFSASLAWNGSLYFYVYASGGSTFYADLYVTNGTAGNATKLTPSGGTHSTSFQDMIVYKNRLYFTWATAAESEELWVTDGTPGGTQLFKALYPANVNTSGGAYPELFHILNDMLLFFAYNGTSGSDRSLWASNGTAAGTQVIAAVGDGPNLDDMVLMNGRYYFPGRAHGGSNHTLWSTDGTAGGTYEVSSAVRPDDWWGSRKMVSIGTRLVFQGTDGTAGYEPWVSNGTAGGTQRLADIYPGSSSSYRTGLVGGGWIAARGSKAYFVARRSDADFQLYETDGTTDGTRIIAPSGATVTTNPVGMPAFTGVTGVPVPVLNGSTLFMRAGYTSAGHELYKF